MTNQDSLLYVKLLLFVRKLVKYFFIEEYMYNINEMKNQITSVYL